MKRLAIILAAGALFAPSLISSAGADQPGGEQLLNIVTHDEQRIAQLETEVHTGLPHQASAVEVSTPAELAALARRIARLEHRRGR